MSIPVAQRTRNARTPRTPRARRTTDVNTDALCDVTRCPRRALRRARLKRRRRAAHTKAPSSSSSTMKSSKHASTVDRRCDLATRRRRIQRTATTHAATTSIGRRRAAQKGPTFESTVCRGGRADRPTELNPKSETSVKLSYTRGDYQINTTARSG